ncbi:hypothetical protein IL306_009975 [Fusarium sp. DS 682]|nr:hypothetical protein IL306_009975 [Fusarium sp. DS 682]
MAFSRGRGRGGHSGCGNLTAARSSFNSRGASRGGFGGRGHNNLSRGGRGSSGPGRTNFAHSQGQGNAHSSRGGIQKAKSVIVDRSQANKSADSQDMEAVPSASNSTRGSGSQATISTFPETCIISRGEEGIKEAQKMIDLAFQNSTHDQLSLYIDPLIRNSNEVARRRRLTRQVQLADEPTLAFNRVPQALMENSQDHLSEEPGFECILCGSMSHNLSTCLIFPKGELRGCPLCLDTGHFVDDSPQFKEKTITEQVRILIDGRANMPPLSTKTPWWDWLYNWLQDDASKGQELPVGFPWSKQFTTEIATWNNCRGELGLQVVFDKSGHDRNLLPKDPSTHTLDAVYSNHIANENSTWITGLVKRVLGEVFPSSSL